MSKLDLSKNHFLYLKYQQKIKWKIEDRFKFQLFSKNFGKDAAKNLIGLRNDREKFIEGCYDFLNDDFRDFINNYKEKFETASSMDAYTNDGSPYYVWICWMQGEESMPEIVKLCIQSITKNMPANAKVVVLTAKNIEDYVTFPKDIIRKVRRGSITLTHFSDLLRFELLRKYGGLWIDSTCYISAGVPNDLINRPIYTIQAPQNPDDCMNDFYGRITSFIIGGSGLGRVFFDFCIEFFYEYHRRYNILIDWHLINIVYALAYRNFDAVKTMIDSIGVNNANVQELNNHANEAAELYSDLLSNPSQYIHKMNWRKVYQESSDSGEGTVFAMMKKQLGE